MRVFQRFPSLSETITSGVHSKMLKSLTSYYIEDLSCDKVVQYVLVYNTFLSRISSSFIILTSLAHSLPVVTPLYSNKKYILAVSKGVLKSMTLKQIRLRAEYKRKLKVSSHVRNQQFLLRVIKPCRPFEDERVTLDLCTVIELFFLFTIEMLPSFTTLSSHHLTK